jgi:hypothetical protein
MGPRPHHDAGDCTHHVPRGTLQLLKQRGRQTPQSLSPCPLAQANEPRRALRTIALDFLLALDRRQTQRVALPYREPGSTQLSEQPLGCPGTTRLV